MPKLVLGVPETQESVVRPVVFEVARNILKLTGLPDDTPIQIPGATGVVVMPGSQLTKTAENNSFGSGNKFQIEVTEEYPADRALCTSVLRYDNQPIFLDDRLGVELKPVYTRTQVTLSVSFRANSRNQAERWRNEIRTRTSMGRVEHLHEVKYHYPIPREYLVILHEIYKRREAKAPYGETLKQWFNDCFVNRMTAVVDQAGKNPTVSISEAQIGIIGWFDFESEPERGAKDDPENGAWMISFDYVFTFDKVTDVFMRYPMMIHNQLLPSKLRGKEVPSVPEHYNRAPSFTNLVIGSFEQGPAQGYGMDGVSIPPYDDWLPIAVPRFTNSVLRVMLSVNEADLREIADLNDLGNYTIHPSIVRYMKANAQWLSIPGECAVLVTLFRKELALKSDAIVVDDTLKVRATADLSLRENYHLRLGLVVDLAKLSSRALQALRADPEAFFNILLTIDNQLKGSIPPLLGGTYLPKKEFDDLIYELSDNYVGRGDWQERRFLTVGNFLITTHQEP